MIKRTLYFGNPAYLSLRRAQLVIKALGTGEQPASSETTFKETTRPIEDLGVVVLDHRQITITQAALDALLQNQCAVVTCDERHMPAGLFLPLEANSVQHERWQAQIGASLPLKKQLWAQNMKAKILNQATVLETCTGVPAANLRRMAKDIRSGDPDNFEGHAAAYYWKNLFAPFPGSKHFLRHREGLPPNNLLNYGYAILRAVIARALVGSGLLPTLGIHHHNRYNAYCLADDMMESYRPFVDHLVFNLIEEKDVIDEEFKKEDKAALLSIPTLDVVISGKRSPLMVAASQTTASLAACFSGETRTLVLPEFRAKT